MRRDNIAYLFVAPSIIVMIVLVFYPLGNGIRLSLTDANQYNVARRMGVKEIPATYEYIGLENYKEIFNNDLYMFWEVFRQNIIWTVFNVIPHILIGLSLALLLNRKFRGRSMYRALLIVPWAIPSYISGFTWRFLFNAQYGAINNVLEKIGIGGVEWLSDPNSAMFAVIVANTWLAIPFNMVTLLGGLQSIPPDLYEAADVDGANPLQKFRHVTLPLLRPVMMTATLLGTIWTFNAFNVIFLVTEGGPARKTEILSTWAWRLGFQQQWQFGIAAAYSVIILLILIIFSLAYLRVVGRSGDRAL